MTEKKQHSEKIKLFLRHVDDIVRTVKADPEEMLNVANQLRSNLKFSLESANEKGNLAFFDINVNVNKRRNVICGLYQKPTDTGTILNFRSYAPLIYERNIKERAVH